MDSDDQNFNKKCDMENSELVLDIDKINGNSNQKQYVDGNGNQVVDDDKDRTQNNEHEAVECSCVGVNGNLSQINDNHIDEKIMRKLQAMSISDDDYGKLKLM
jgi:formiminotetrahydrofolate cyclodeaminase